MSTAGPAARRHPQDRHVVPPGRAVPQPARSSRTPGILYPADRFDAHFLAALDLMRLPWGGLEAEAVGAWDRLRRQVREWDGTAIISHEILATASRAQVRRALESLGHPDAEVHVVLSVRDLVRQIPAEWQENVKHRRELSYARFLDRSRTRPARAGSPPGSGASRRSPTSSTAGATTCRPSACTSSPCRRPGAPPQPAVGAVQPGLRARRPRPRPRGRAREPVARGARDRPDAADQPGANQVLGRRRYRPLVRELLAHQTLSRPGRRGSRCPPDARTPGRRS